MMIFLFLLLECPARHIKLRLKSVFLAFIWNIQLENSTEHWHYSSIKFSQIIKHNTKAEKVFKAVEKIWDVMIWSQLVITLLLLLVFSITRWWCCTTRLSTTNWLLALLWIVEYLKWVHLFFLVSKYSVLFLYVQFVICSQYVYLINCQFYCLFNLLMNFRFHFELSINMHFRIQNFIYI